MDTHFAVGGVRLRMTRHTTALALLLAACSSAPPLPLTAPNPAFARVYVIDGISGVYGALGYDVVVDGRTLCTIRGQQFAVLDLDAGKHRFAFGGPHATPQDFNLSAGTVTYLGVKMPKVREREDASLLAMDELVANEIVATATRVETLLPLR